MRIISLDYLRDVRRQAYRKRVWYRAIDSLERGIINLTIRFVESVKSLRLTKVLEGIVLKLSEAMKSRFTRHVETYGVGKLVELVAIAEGFGSVVARGWLRDKGFPRLIALNHMNNPGVIV